MHIGKSATRAEHAQRYDDDGRAHLGSDSFHPASICRQCDSCVEGRQKQRAGVVPRPLPDSAVLIDYGAAMRVIEPDSSSSIKVSPCTM